MALTFPIVAAIAFVAVVATAGAALATYALGLPTVAGFFVVLAAASIGVECVAATMSR